MATLFDRDTRTALVARLDRLKGDSSTRQWGRMTSAQMVAHCNAALRMALGDLAVPPRKMFLAHKVVRYLVIHLLPIPKNLPTARELQSDPAAVDFEAERAAMKELLDRFGRCEPGGTWPVHPAFGDLSGKEWGVQQYGHIDHHFKQFGI